MLTPTDLSEFREAVRLIRAVIDRHPRELTGPIITAVELAVHDIGVVERYLGVAGVSTDEAS